MNHIASMKRVGRPRSIVLLSVAVAAFAAAPALGSMTVRFSDSWGSTRGGEFTARTTGSMPGYAVPAEFQSFCLERNESIIFGRVNGADPFNVDSIADYADAGGEDGGPNDPLDLRTKWLYEQFATGSLADYNYSGNRGRSADALQRAIWYLEEEISGSSNGDGLTGDSQADAFLQMADAAIAGGWTDTGRVRVMNISWAVNYGGYHVGDLAQSQLVLIPAPGAVVLGIVGCGVLAIMRRRVTAV